MSALLGFIGAAMGSTGAFGFGAPMGWFIGSTLGTLLSLESSHTHTSSGRIASFKAYNSKYGIPISKGYGCARFAGNLIWRSAVEEVATVNSQCITTGGFFGIGGSTQCVHTTTYEYRQSAAIAFCEGPATSISRIWADGELILDRRGITGSDVNLGRVRTLASTKDYNPYYNNIIRTYLGTLTQKPDPLIKKALSPDNSESGLDEVYAFRSIVYMIVDGMDLLPFGYRMPTFTAEVCFSDLDDPTYTYLERPSIFPTVGENSLGMVHGHPNLLAGVALGTYKRRTLYDMSTNELLFEAAGVFRIPGEGVDFSDSSGHKMLSPDFNHISHIFPWNKSWMGPGDFLTGRLNYLVRFRPFFQAGIENVLYDPVRNGLWVNSHLTADLGFYSLGDRLFRSPRITEEGLGITLQRAPLNYPVGVVEDFGERVLEYIPEENGDAIGGCAWWSSGPTSKIGGRQPAGLSGRCLSMHLMEDGGVIWSVTSSGLYNCWINFAYHEEGNRLSRASEAAVANANFLSKGYKVYNHLGEPFIDIWGSIYLKDDRSVIVVASVLATSSGEGGIYKVFLDDPDAWDNDLDRVTLPAPGTAGFHLPNQAFEDSPAFMRGDFGGGKFCYRTGLIDHIFIDGLCMEVESERDLLPLQISGLGSSCTLYFAHLDCSILRPNGVVYWGGTGQGQGLDEIVTDLMTEVDGDQVRYLVPSDIDVTELTDTVRGFSVTRQQTIRGSIAQLMQGFFFDAVESDGKIKFRKRGQTPSFTIPEGDTRAVAYNTVKGGTASLEYERRTENELPRELAIAYPDIDNDYLQVTQRLRRQAGEADSNISLSFQIVFNKDEAAQVADVLMFDAWQERQTNYRFTASQKHILIEPGDVGVLTMQDGATHRLRVIRTEIGANGVTEFTAVEEFENSYLSNAIGSNSRIDPNLVQDRTVLALLLEVTTRCLADPVYDTPALIGGIGAVGSNFNGGRLLVGSSKDGWTLAAAKGREQALKWGAVGPEIGHPNNAIATNVYDTETQLSIDMIGGEFPVSGTDDEVLSGQRLMIIDREIVGYKTVVSPNDIRVDAVDISFDAATDSINSTSTDFVAAGFTIGMQLYFEDGSPQLPNFYWEVATVSTNQITVTGNITVTQAAGGRVIFRQAGRTVIVSNLLRGLYGTQNHTYHRGGARVYFTDNLFPITLSDTTPFGDLIVAFATPIWGGNKNYTNHQYRADNVAPWPPVNLGYSAGSITWDRMDRIYSDGIDPALPTELGEKFEEYIVRHIDHNTPGDEGRALTKFNTEVPRTSQISVPSLPILVEVYQKNQYTDAKGSALLSDPLQEVVSSDGNYSGGGDVSVLDTGILRWNKESGATTGVKEGIPEGPFVGTNALTFRGVSTFRMSGLEMLTGACKDIEVLARVYPSTFTDTYGTTCGIFLRGSGNTADGGTDQSITLGINGFMAGFGGFGQDSMIATIYNGGGSSDNSFRWPADAEIPYDWGQYGNFGQKFWIRARAYKHRFQVKVWIDGETEPSSWMMDCYDDSYGPFFGSCGLYTRAPDPFNSYRGIYCDYFSWAHRGGTAT